ncbi:MAG: excinuclease ABC subunit UvrC [Hyphomicrobiaceae bacterium]|nr:excinuclease ABC subunit UvrC [Hyphomicrobiaceae bacterium]
MSGSSHKKAKSKKRTSGPEVIARVLKTLPALPGVYRMLDEHDNVLYVGKAKALSKRVVSYTRLNGHTNRIQRMIMATVSMEIITTKTESEALLLEANLIKRLKPRYNVLLRDDKAFPYILIADDHEAPQLLKHRGARKRKGDYYGPFASAGAVNQALNSLQRAFLLRSCTDSVYANRTRPCLLFQIKRCSAPCTGEIELADYGELVVEARRFLSGKSTAVQTHLAKRMEDASQQQLYEQAATFRDRLAALTHVQGGGGVNAAGFEEADIFAVFVEGGQTCIQVFFFRTGQNWGNRAYYPRIDASHEEAEILESFIAQFYDNKPCPSVVLVSHDFTGRLLLEKALGEKSGRKIAVNCPLKGEKRTLIEHALANARQALGRKMAESASQKKLLAGLAEAFALDEPPRRIEIFDNSHIQGTSAIGAMVVYGAEGWIKSQYRKFNIKSTTITPGDDFGMMREVMERRFAALLKLQKKGELDRQGEDPDAIPMKPDLLLIDGGAGQVSAVGEILAELGINDIPYVGVAKGADRNAGRERFFIPGQQAFTLDPRDPVMYFTQRLRDEAHRFAIGSHRAKRKKNMAKNPLDEVPGIGATRKKALLLHFGSAKAVINAAVRDMAQVEGISKKMAQNIYDFFHDEAGS